MKSKERNDACLKGSWKRKDKKRKRPEEIQKYKCSYAECPKIFYTLVSDKIAYANSADPDQTAPEGAV